MRVVHYRDAYQNDIPRIIQPERALGYIRRSLSSQPGFNQTVFGLDSLLSDCGISYAPSQHQIDSALSRVAWRFESGDFFLLGDRDDDFGSIQFFGDISPFVSPTFRERVKRLPPRPQFGHGNYSKASEPIVEPNITPAPEAPAELKETGITKAINAMMGGAKQVINDYIDEQRASQAEWLADKGIIQAKDEATGQILTPEELGERYRGNPTLPLADNELAGAEAVQSFVGYEAALLVLEAATNRKKLVTDLAEFKEEAGKILSQINTKFPNALSEALGQYGAEQVYKDLGLKQNEGFIHRYHGCDNMMDCKKRGLVEIEHKGYNSDSTSLSRNQFGERQGSDDKNLRWSKRMKKKAPKVGQASNRKGGPYEQKEQALWQSILDKDGKKNHLAIFTNTETGKVRYFWQDNKGNLLPPKDGALQEFTIPEFETVKSTFADGLNALKGNK
jgi:hypothetical protein